MAAPGSRWSLLLLRLAGLAHGTSALFVVKDSNGTACTMASFSASFFTIYETGHGSQNSTFELPSSAEVLISNSSCGRENASEPILTIAFGSGYLLTLNFTRNATRYRVQHMYFAYNLSDTQHFLNASDKGIHSVDSSTDIKADISKTYRCLSALQVHMGNVTITLSDATIQAYLSNSNFSKEETRCTQDGPSPTTVPPSPSPPRVPTNPIVIKYSVTGEDGTCLLASMTLQMNVKDNMTVTRALNISPNDTASGSCRPHVVILTVESRNSILDLKFGMNGSSSLFFLQEVQLNMTLLDANVSSLITSNQSLRALQATVGNSYKCNTEEHIYVTKEFSLNVFSVQVQAFKVESDRFGSVEECMQDGNNILSPIAVGGALAGLVLNLLIAYLISRKRSHAGYQTF
ncbi:lysosome-associated membrane glycoprotein 1 [Cricetulus griseus]|uniref:Lysosome-associated membrane glycoprotein 1 n=1 Tax=Cricetulus griseus TaxID=10029 RepID=G3I7Y3_CRIGR|nr:lysosome-associated membrane glycoprotein 1 [Cricetulus griseus]XP_027260557.1 lysosome-associated membrane glycoprotein 1 [Cricetulus griseus]EGW13352.1 Lysosome-associated membrane glycoprotein 1 [Cricetulus griseus]ERE78111.1 lysosome-associated membrane glycoprotein 1 [Cricetulus griseus]